MRPSAVVGSLTAASAAIAIAVASTTSSPGALHPPRGAMNPAVTQATIRSTICVPGWTARVRPPSSYTTALKVRQMRAQGLRGKSADYEEDHLVPLALGGAPRDPANLWPEPWPNAHGKDVVEARVHRAVCAGRMTLAAGRRVFTTGAWRKQVHPP